MIKHRKLQLWLVCLVLGGTVLGTIGQLELPLLLKQWALLLPLQLAALGYVAWYWRQPRSPALSAPDSSTERPK